MFFLSSGDNEVLEASHYLVRSWSKHRLGKFFFQRIHYFFGPGEVIVADVVVVVEAVEADEVTTADEVEVAPT